MSSSGDVTLLLRRVSQGDRDAEAELIPQIYNELRKRALWQMRRERAGHSMQATDLVHEVYLKLAGQKDTDWKDRIHFFSIAAQLMRNILVDHARKRNAAKRGGNSPIAPILSEIAAISESSCEETIVVDDLLAKLAKQDPRQARIVEMRYFVGLTHEEIGLLLKVSSRTVKRDWDVAKAWLRAEASALAATSRPATG